MDRIKELSEVFAEYRIYPKKLYTDDTPVKVFQGLYPDNYYTDQIEVFLQSNDYETQRRGADLPWWGKSYFASAKGYRVFIISQDSLSYDAGSIVFFANLFSVCNSRVEYDCYHSSLGPNQSFRYSSWIKVKELLVQWKLELESLYITDAAKVYKPGSWKDRDFDKKRSKKLLEKEIRFCNPDLLIILGSAGLTLLLPDFKYGEVVDNGKLLSVLGVKTIIVPFPIGNGPTQPNFKKRLQLASEQIFNAVGSTSLMKANHMKGVVSSG